MNSDILNYAILLPFVLLQIFICNYCSEYLLNESTGISEAAYFATFNCASNRCLLMIILMAQKPVQLTAGDYIDLSFETFGKVVKTAFSFFAIARNFNL